MENGESVQASMSARAPFCDSSKRRIERHMSPSLQFVTVLSCCQPVYTLPEDVVLPMPWAVHCI